MKIRAAHLAAWANFETNFDSSGHAVVYISSAQVRRGAFSPDLYFEGILRIRFGIPLICARSLVFIGISRSLSLQNQMNNC